jgi:hypothetical protein
MMRTLILTAAALAIASAAPARDDLSAELRAKDQALLDAIAPGNRALWEQMLAPEAVYVDENGAVMDRQVFLETLTPLPAYASGQIRIVEYRLNRVGDTALVVHRDAEHEVWHGVPLDAQYLMSETWVRQRGEWRLAQVHAQVARKDPPETSLPSATLDAYAGRYRLTDGVELRIRRDGDRLMAAATGRPEKPMLAESTDVFFTPGQPRSRRIFFRNGSGQVFRMVDRREGEDLVYRRIR